MLSAGSLEFKSQPSIMRKPTDCKDARVASLAPRRAAEGMSKTTAGGSCYETLLVTACVAALRLNIGDIEIFLDKLLVERRQSERLPLSPTEIR